MVKTFWSMVNGMDPIEHALDDFGRAIINRDNLPLTVHELAQALTKDSDALDFHYEPRSQKCIDLLSTRELSNKSPKLSL